MPFPKAIEERRFNELALRFKEALDFAQQPGEIVFSDRVEKVWTEVYKQLQEERPGIAGVLTNRSEVHVIRIALVFALLDKSNLIDIQHMRAALAIWDYCASSVCFIFGIESDEGSSKILLALENGPRSQTEISKLFSGHLSADKLRQKLSDLEALGKIERELIRNPGTRTKTVWRLTENILENYAS